MSLNPRAHLPLMTYSCSMWSSFSTNVCNCLRVFMLKHRSETDLCLRAMRQWKLCAGESMSRVLQTSEQYTARLHNVQLTGNSPALCSNSLVQPSAWHTSMRFCLCRSTHGISSKGPGFGTHRRRLLTSLSHSILAAVAVRSVAIAGARGTHRVGIFFLKNVHTLIDNPPININKSPKNQHVEK